MVKNRKKIKISVIILQGSNIDNKNYKKCLDSVSFADQVIKVDTSKLSGSFSEWRNEGLDKALGQWILYIDTDEEVTKDVKFEILNLIKNDSNETGAFAIPRRNFIFGKEFRYSGQYPDYQKRLFKKVNLKRWVGRIHEEPDYVGDLGHLKNPIIHHKDMTVSQMIEKTNKWSEIEAELMVLANHPKMNIFRFFTAGFREFYLRFIKQMAILDGTEGIIYGIYQIYSRLISYSKLWEKQLSTIHT